jgi:hypothetical protein
MHAVEPRHIDFGRRAPQQGDVLASRRLARAWSDCVASTINALAKLLRTRFDTRRHIGTMSSQWLREHEADYSKHG